MLPSPGTNTVHVKTCSEGHLEGHEGKHIYRRQQVESTESVKKKKSDKVSATGLVLFL